MALRQLVPVFEPSFEGVPGSAKPVPRLAEAVKVGFRAGADLGSVVEAIKLHRMVQVVAATGAGKSTRLPGLVAAALKVLVVQVFPNSYFSADMQAYVSSQGVSAEFVETVDTVLPEQGVVCLSAANLAARWLAAGSVAMPECVVMHDESHESDAYTGLVKRLAPTCAQVRSYVTLTATPEGADFRRAEMEGELIKRTYPAGETADKWNIYGEGPWSVDSIKGHVMIYVDDRTVAEKLAMEYRTAGFTVYRFHSRMSMQEFRVAMQFIRSGTYGIVVVIADSSFRSSLTAPFSRIIDTAVVTRVVSERGRPIYSSRQAYELEKYQAAGRGARLSGLVTEYYCPDSSPIKRICDLEAVEVEALVLMLRVLGYAVPRDMQAAAMARGGFPRDLCEALRGKTPLALLAPVQLVSEEDFFKPSGRRSPFMREDVVFQSQPMDLYDSRVTAETASKYGYGPVGVQSRAAPEAYHGGRRYESGRRDSFQDQYTGCLDAVRAMAMYEDPVEEVELGMYYYAVGCASAELSCSMFPDGADSVCRWLTSDKSESAHLGLSPYNRGVAVSALISRYNVLTCELKALTRVITTARTQAGGKDHAALGQWARTTSGRMTQVVAELSVLGKYLMRLASGHCSLAEMPPLVEEEGKLFSYMSAGLEMLPDAQVGPSAKDFGAVREYIEGPARVYAPVEYGNLQLESVPMPVTGRGMRASSHYVAPGGLLGWATGKVPLKGGKLLRVDSSGRKAYVRSNSSSDKG